MSITKGLYKLTINFSGKPSEEIFGDSYSKLMEKVFSLFEPFYDEKMPVDAEMDRSGRIAYICLVYGGNLPKEKFRLRDTLHPMTSASLESRPRANVFYSLKHSISAFSHKTWGIAGIRNGEVCKFYPYCNESDAEGRHENSRNISDIKRDFYGKFYLGFVEGASFREARMPDFLKNKTEVL